MCVLCVMSVFMFNFIVSLFYPGSIEIKSLVLISNKIKEFIRLLMSRASVKQNYDFYHLQK
jgi:hypothetical protein